MEWSGTFRQEKRIIFFVPYLTHPHAFRHTFATRCFESGIKPKVISKYLGHATIQTTMDLYVHADEQCQALEMQKLKGFFSEPEFHCSLSDSAKGVIMEKVSEKMG